MYEEISIEELVKFQPKELKEHTIGDADYTDHACSYISVNQAGLSCLAVG